jgi:hypothetical protein
MTYISLVELFLRIQFILSLGGFLNINIKLLKLDFDLFRKWFFSLIKLNYNY